MDLMAYGWKMQDPRCKGLFVTGGSQAPAAATQNLVELSCCKLKKIYALCENFIYIGQRPVPLDQYLSLRLASRWASMILLGSASALLAECASYWVQVSQPSLGCRSCHSWYCSSSGDNSWREHWASYLERPPFKCRWIVILGVPVTCEALWMEAKVSSLSPPRALVRFCFFAMEAI